MKHILALILAAGHSKRLWPLSDKSFIKFLGRPLVSYSIEQLVRFGYKELVIVVNKENKPYFERLKTQYSSVSITLVQQGSQAGMSGALLTAQDIIKDKPLLVIGPTDVYEDFLFADFQKMLPGVKDGVLSGTKLDSYFPGAYLTVDKGLITGIVEKPDPGQTPSNLVNFVFDYFKRGNDIVEEVKKEHSTKDDHYEVAIKNLITQGYIFKLLSYNGYWGYLKYPWHVLSLSSYFLGRIKEKRIKNATIAASAKIEGNVIIQDGAKIMEYAKIVGPSYIGRGTIIGDHALIRESMIGDHCVVGFTTEIARSVIGDHCWLHKNYIGDSVLAENICMGAGAVTANFRLDEQEIISTIGNTQMNTHKVKFGAIIGAKSRIGVNASLMPGVKVGRNNFIGSGVVLDEDTQDNQFVSLSDKNIQIRENVHFKKGKK